MIAFCFTVTITIAEVFQEGIHGMRNFSRISKQRKGEIGHIIEKMTEWLQC